MNRIKGNNTSKNDTQKKIILRQNHEIEKLREKISELEITTDRKDDLTETIDNLYAEWIDLINELEEKRNEINKLVCDLQMIKDIMSDVGIKIPWYKRIFK